MKKLLCTGAAGSIGIHVISNFLKNTNWNIVVLDSFRHKGYKDRIDRIIKDNPEWKKRITEFSHDLVCPIPPEMIKAMGKVDYILHLAAMSDVPFSVENPVYVIQNNVNSTLTMLEYARVIKPEIFLYFSTDEVHGPLTEGEEYHKEWSTHRPSNAYAASKAASEDICYSYWRNYDVPVIITNTTNNFGPMQSASKFPVIVQKKIMAGEVVEIHGNKKEMGTRFYIDSRRVASILHLIIKAGVHHHIIGEVDAPLRYHIADGKRYSNLELAQTIAKLMGKKLKYKLIDFHGTNRGHDIHYGLQSQVICWDSSKKTVEDYLEDTIKWQINNKEWL